MENGAHLLEDDDEGLDIRQNRGLDSLPHEILSHVQSSLPIKDAAKSSLLSSIFGRAWTYGPTLVFDLHRASSKQDPSELATSIIRKYKLKNLKADKVVIVLVHKEDTVIATQLIEDALDLEVKDFSLDSNEFLFPYALPARVFVGEDMRSISLYGCQINTLPENILRAPKLVVLYLQCVSFKTASVQDIISRYPSIEYLDITHCSNVEEITVSTLNKLKYLKIAQPRCSIQFIQDGIVPKFGRLDTMFLEDMVITETFFINFSSQFPVIESLTLKNCTGYQVGSLSSKSMKSLSFSVKSRETFQRGEFDVPNVSKFKYAGARFVPVLSFTSISEECNSEISFDCKNDDFVSFPELRSFLTALGSSKIDLKLIGFNAKNDSLVEDTMPDDYLPLVDNVNIISLHISEDYTDFLTGIFSCCRPHIITDKNLSDSGSFRRFLYNALKDHLESLKKIPVIHDLKDASAGVLGKQVLGWHAITSNNFSSETIEHSDEVSFMFMWESLEQYVRKVFMLPVPL